MYWARTDTFTIQCNYPVGMTIKTTYDTLATEISETATQTGTNNMIGEFSVTSYSDDDFTKVIASDNPISVGSPIYTKISVSNLPSSLTYQVLNCQIQNTGNENWEADSEYVNLWQDQTCLNDVVQAVGFTVDTTNLENDNVYAFQFNAFIFVSQTENQNTLTLVSFHVKESDF